MNSTKHIPVRIVAGCGMLAAVAAVLQYIEIPIPSIMPAFITLDFSDLPEVLGAFAYGPIAGVMIALVKNVIHLLASKSIGVGELSNFILGASFAFTQGFIYARHKAKKTALIAGLAASAVMAIVSLPSNYFIIYPMYYNVMGYPETAILEMYRAIMPSCGSIWEALVCFNMPFTFIKGLICVGISMLVYKPLSPILKGKH